MNTAKVYFEDGNTLTTQMNATPEQIEKYYVGQRFQFGDTEECPRDKMVKAVKVEHLKTYNFSFRGREAIAIGIFYDINTKIEAFNDYDAFNELYNSYEHILGLKLNGKRIEFDEISKILIPKS